MPSEHRQTATIQMSDLLEAADVPEGSDIHAFHWVDDGLQVVYDPREDEDDD